MLETKEQKQIFAGSIVLIIILGAISLSGHPNFQYRDNTDYQALQQKNQKEQAANNAFLAVLGTTAQAQQAALEQILPKEQLQAAVEQALDANQKITIPVIADSQIKISKTSTKTAMQSYLDQSAPLFKKLQTEANSSAADIFNPGGDVTKINSLAASATADIAAMKKIVVPQDAAGFHKQLIVGLMAYSDLMALSKTYMTGQNQNPWPATYKNYQIITSVLAAGNTEFNQLNSKYKLTDAGDKSLAKGNWLVPKASAQLATIDIWQKAQQILQQAAATSISQFMLNFLGKLANKIESSYKISNFLYYTDALVSGEYVDDYLNKYVSDPLDREMAKNFIPEVTCGKGKDLNQAFTAKANQYLGFDPTTLDPNDPDYYQKLAKVGNYMSSAQGWKQYYQGLAAQAEAKAQEAASNEINSPGQKAGRDTLGGIVTPSQVSSDVLKSVFERYMQEGNSNSVFSTTQQITSQIASQFLNSFALKGVTLLEQKACIAVPQLQLVTQVQ